VRDARVQRQPASALKDNSDLGERLVTTDVPQLEPALVLRALKAGLQKAQALRAAGLIFSAALVCQNQILNTHENLHREADSTDNNRRHGLVLA